MNLEWTKEAPKKQGWYWHWNGDEDSSPFVFSVLWSGTSKKCFISRNQTENKEPVDCDIYGGYWMKIEEPPIPSMINAPLPELKGSFPVVLYFGNDADRDEFVEVVKQCKPNLVASKI